VSADDGGQQLDGKTLSKLETAISKSPLIGQGKKLKTTNKVCHNIYPNAGILGNSHISTGRPLYHGWSRC
jgi:F-type H+-transporting ATPase subunit O